MSRAVLFLIANVLQLKVAVQKSAFVASLRIPVITSFTQNSKHCGIHQVCVSCGYIERVYCILMLQGFLYYS